MRKGAEKQDFPGWFRWSIVHGNIAIAYRDHEAPFLVRMLTDASHSRQAVTISAG
ncbi:MAG: hypothetical protein ABI036_03065 [Fibrobacteria bacterium]